MSEAELLYEVSEGNRLIQVWQQESLRWLEFGDDLIQSVMDMDRADYLPESFSRAMLSGVMFQQQSPNKVLLAGTGGGTTARYLSSRFPNIKGDAVELSANVIEIAKQYFEFPESHNWQCHQADIRDYLQQCKQQQYDVIIFDIAEGPNSPVWLKKIDLLQSCYDALAPGGYLSINLITKDNTHFLEHLSTLRQVFNKRTVCLSLPEHRNVILFAFKQAEEDVLPTQSSLKHLQQQWQIEFSDFYEQMKKDNPTGSGVI